MSRIGQLKFQLQLDYYYLINKIAVSNHIWQPKVMSMDETLDYILQKHISIARFGDGEFKWMLNIPQNSFQKQDERLRRMLLDAIHTNTPNLLLCVSDCFGDLSQYKLDVQKFWSMVMVQERKQLQSIFMPDYRFGNLNVTRFYIDYNESSHVPSVLKKWKKIWDNQDILIVEGSLTRLGVGNDLFDNVNSIHRILAPAENAFSQFDNIMQAIRDNAKKDQLILLALGPTATVLATELSKEQYWALDVGHIDIEYEWYRHKAKTKTPVRAKYVNEAAALGGRIVSNVDDQVEMEKYQDQIVDKVGIV